MKSAEHLFLEKGVDETSIEDITRGVAVSKGSFYLHFSSKTDVLEALRDRFVDDILQGITREVGKQEGDDWHGKLKAWTKACASSYLEAARLHDLVFSRAPPPSRDGMTSNILIDNLAALLAGGNGAKAWSLADPAFTAIFLFNALHGVVNQPGIGESAASRSRLLLDLEDHFLRFVC